VRALIVTGSALVVLALCAPAGAATNCGSIFREGPSPEHISATGETCKNARSLASLVSKGTSANGCIGIATGGFRLAKPCLRRSYSCRVLRRLGEDRAGIRIGCRRGTRTVNWDIR
jgi:hypothetical protein